MSLVIVSRDSPIRTWKQDATTITDAIKLLRIYGNEKPPYSACAIGEPKTKEGKFGVYLIREDSVIW